MIRLDFCLDILHGFVHFKSKLKFEFCVVFPWMTVLLSSFAAPMWNTRVHEYISVCLSTETTGTATYVLLQDEGCSCVNAM